MGREWKPGDVAVTAKNTIALCHSAGQMIDQNGAPWSDDKFPDNLRPLVVIDSKDREQVAALADAFCIARWSHIAGSDECDPLTRSSMKEALDAYLNPTPPKPEEPLGYGAVIEDADGYRWLCNRADPGITWSKPWFSTDLDEWRDYSNIAAVKVLSEGVR